MGGRGSGGRRRCREALPSYRSYIPRQAGRRRAEGRTYLITWEEEEHIWGRRWGRLLRAGGGGYQPYICQYLGRRPHSFLIWGRRVAEHGRRRRSVGGKHGIYICLASSRGSTWRRVLSIWRGACLYILYASGGGGRSRGMKQPSSVSADKQHSREGGRNMRYSMFSCASSAMTLLGGGGGSTLAC